MDGNGTIVRLEDAAEGQVGGKAAGLARLLGLGFQVPKGFVILGASPGQVPAAAREAFQQLGGTVAVRSSALGEDGEQASFAGQYETVLGVGDETAFVEAVDHCLRSLHSPRAASYQAKAEAAPSVRSMAVVVQRMVPAAAAGVLFTVDPLTGRRDRMAIDAVRGLGEALVSGRATPDHFLMGKDGRLVRRELASEAPVLTEGQLAQLVAEARRAEEAFGRPLDMEWAFDAQGALFWLQARPVTVTAGDLHEFDYCLGEDHVFTTANIGEMLPGASCPLALSTTVWGIDQGNQNMWLSTGTICEPRDEFVFIGVFNGHLFIDITANNPFNCSVIGASPEAACVTLVGHVVPEVVAQAPRYSLWHKLRSGVGFARYLWRADGEALRHEREVQAFRLAQPSGARAAWEAIDLARPFLRRSYCVHLQVSAKTAVMSGILEAMLQKRQVPVAEREAIMAEVLAGAGDVTSARLIRDFEAVQAIVAAHPDVQARLLSASCGAAQAWLLGPESGSAGVAFRGYLERWGHRANRELDIREKGWRDDPAPLVVSLRASLTGRRAPERAEVAPVRLERALSRSERWARKKAQRGVVMREFTKNLLVATSDHFKRAYRHLAVELVAEGRLAQADDVYFLTHQELGRLARGEEPGLAGRAPLRRETWKRQQTFRYPAVSVGRPEPLRDETPVVEGGELRGKPVSAGRVAGRVRVARVLEEAAALQPGEILVAPYTDVSWTPYFNLLGGLVTEVGSAFCHGAVVAREYGLPTLVNVRGATQLLQTGEHVLLDADHGVLRRLTADEFVAHSAGAAAPQGELPAA